MQFPSLQPVPVLGVGQPSSSPAEASPGAEFTFQGTLPSCCPCAQLHSPPVMLRAKAFFPRDSPPARPCPLCLTASDPVIPTHARAACLEIMWKYKWPLPPPARRVDVPCSRIFWEMLMGAASSTRLDRICVFPVLISWEENMFSPHLQLRFSKKSSLRGPQNWRATERSPALPSTVPFPDNPLLLRLEIPESWRTRLIICRHAAILGTI